LVNNPCTRGGEKNDVNVIQIKHLSHSPIIINVCVYKTNVGNGNLFNLKYAILQKQKILEEE